MLVRMTPLTITIILAGILLAALARPLRRVLLRVSGLRLALSGLLALATTFCIYGALASGEICGPEAILWRTAYLLLGAWTLLGCLFLLLHQPPPRGVV